MSGSGRKVQRHHAAQGFLRRARQRRACARIHIGKLIAPCCGVGAARLLKAAAAGAEARYSAALRESASHFTIEEEEEEEQRGPAMREKLSCIGGLKASSREEDRPIEWRR